MTYQNHIQESVIFFMLSLLFWQRIEHCGKTMNVLMKTLMVAVVCAMFINMEVASAQFEEAKLMKRVLINKGTRDKVRHNNSTTVSLWVSVTS